MSRKATGFFALSSKSVFVILMQAWPGAAADDAGGFPRDAATLQALNAEQLAIVSEAVSRCWANDGRPQGVGPKACVINVTESVLQALSDPDLHAFHRALPMHVRYDAKRPDSYWQRMVDDTAGHGRP